MEAVLRKWGNSVALRLPSGILRSNQLRVASRLVITEEEGKIVLTPKKKQPHYDLISLLNKITDDNKHESVDFGEPVGKELL